MPAYSAITALHDELTAWRHDLHQHPELAYEEHRTADFVAGKLKEFGIEVVRGLGKTGVVGTLRRGTGARSVGLRADMDALPMQENNSFAHKSLYDGKFHGCGHDGHTVMLLGAAKYLAASESFDGTVYFIFQPAEEGQAGAKAMIDDGLFEQFPMDSVFGMHNWPGLPVGEFALRPGPMMASVAFFDIEVQGVGGHAAMPHTCSDPIVVAAQTVQALQTIISRSFNPLDSGVVSVTQMHAGASYNVIPEHVNISGCTRYFSKLHGAEIESRMRLIVEQVAKAHGITATLDYRENYPVLVNTPAETSQCAEAAAALVGADNVDVSTVPVMGSEDFAFMLEQRPGAYVFIGNGAGQGGCMVHHPDYDFNDEVIPLGASYWVKLVEMTLVLPPI